MKPKTSSKSIGKTKKEQQIVDLGKLPDKIGVAVDFLREHVMSVKGRVSAKGPQIQVEGLKHKEVKLLLHKFLRHHIVTHPRLDEATTPPASATMPYLFPGTPSPVASDKRRRKKS